MAFIGLESPIHWLILVIIPLLFAFWLWMVIDCVQNPKLQGTEKIVWVMVIIFLNWLGALVYYFVGRSK